MSVLVILGTKAQFIKMAPVLREMDRRGTPYRLVYTGQHSETFDVLEAAFNTRPPDDVLVPGFEADTKPSFARWVWRFTRAAAARVRRGEWRGSTHCLVHGDTASTLLGAIAAKCAGISVCHIEAGLRSPKVLDPFPEELIRRLLSAFADVNYAPDAVAAGHLRTARGRVVVTEGNTLLDALAMSLRRSGQDAAEGGGGGYAVFSVHRNENLSSRSDFDLLMTSLVDAASVLPVKFVLHPATRARLAASGWKERLESVAGLELMERMDYPGFVRLLVGSSLLMTDGGSNQEEAAMLGLPTLLLRRATERPDGLGETVELSELDPKVIANFVRCHAGRPWRVRRLPAASPSAIIVDDLAGDRVGPG